MNSRAVQFFCWFVIFTALFESSFGLEKPEEISQEMYCAGCELTVKELDFILRRRPTRGMGETVTRALASVCDLERFKKYEMDAKKVLSVCKHIKGEEELEYLLIKEYGRKHELGQKTTYLDMTQKICGDLLHACPGAEMLTLDDEDGGITYNTETQDFEIKYGRKVRTPNPVRHEETPLPTPTNEIKVDVHKHEEL